MDTALRILRPIFGGDGYLYSNFSYLSLKYSVDKFFAAILLLLLWPVMAIVAIVVKLSSKGSVIFKQERLTDNGRIFTMYKFRSMTSCAETNSGAVWASQNDVRVTTVGKFIRKTRLDELPQLVNVLRGEMSLIGPRPERPEISEELMDSLPNFHYRLQQRAGITGLAQVKNGYAACKESYEKKVELDKFYVENCSARLDLQIALQTVAVVVSGYGAR